MNLFLRLFPRYAGVLGYLDGKRNYPGPQHYVDTPVFEGSTDDAAPAAEVATEPLQFAPAAALTERR